MFIKEVPVEELFATWPKPKKPSIEIVCNIKINEDDVDKEKLMEILRDAAHKMHRASKKSTPIGYKLSFAK